MESRSDTGDDTAECSQSAARPERRESSERRGGEAMERGEGGLGQGVQEAV